MRSINSNHRIVLLCLIQWYDTMYECGILRVEENQCKLHRMCISCINHLEYICKFGPFHNDKCPLGLEWVLVRQQILATVLWKRRNMVFSKQRKVFLGSSRQDHKCMRDTKRLYRNNYFSSHWLLTAGCWLSYGIRSQLPKHTFP